MGSRIRGRLIGLAAMLMMARKAPMASWRAHSRFRCFLALPGILALAITIVLVVAHVFGRGMENEEDTWKVFAVASFVIFGLTLRALTTGLGLP